MNTRLLVAAIIALAAFPAAAQELKSLPGGSLMLKDMPAAQGNVQNLPGVRLNMQAQGGGMGNCTNREVSSLGFGDRRSVFDTGGTVTKCDVGNFSITTVTPSGAPKRNYWEGVPSPFGSNSGPPPGSGGFVPRAADGIW